MSKKTNHRLKIFTSLLLALFVVSYGAPNVFVAGGTGLRPEFVAGISNSPLRFLGLKANPTGEGVRDAEVNTNGIPVAAQEQLVNSHPDKQNLEYKPLVSGVYAAEDPATKEEYIKVDNGTKLEKKYIHVDGRQIMIYVPVQ